MTNLDYRVTEQSSARQDLTVHVGSTPLIALRRLTSRLPANVRVYVKAEWFNPSGSVKDRAALSIIHAALTGGHLAPGKRLLDSTSGNMGVSYATFGAAFGFPVTLTIPASASPERLTALRGLGAEIVLTDPLEGSDGAILEARRLADLRPDVYWYARQYDNPANWQAHYRTTGPEIMTQTEGQVTHFVAGLGTSGTFMGTGRYLRETTVSVRLIAMQPDAGFHGLEGLKHMPSAIRPAIFDPEFADDSLLVSTEAARDMVLRLAREEGLLVGISSGAAAVAALRVAEDLDRGLVVTVFPDGGSRYLSDTSLWGSE